MPTVLPGAYHSPYDRMIAELMMRKGDIQARRAEQQGQIWGRAAENLGQIGAQYVQQRQENQQQKARVAALDQFVDSGIWAKDPQAGLAMSVKILGPVEGVKFFGGLQGASKMMGAQNPEEARKALPMVAGGLIAAPEALRPKLYGHAREMLINSGIAGPDSLPEQWTPELEPYVRSLAGEKTADETVVVPGGGMLVNKKTGAPLATAPRQDRPENPEPVMINGRATLATPTEIAQAKAQGATVAPYQAPSQRDPNAEPLVAIMGPDGQSVLVPRSQAVGKRPASGREQGRPVVSGDANRIADYDTSLNDLATLTTTLSGSHATGAAAKVGAALPNWVTEWTGVGADAKSKQAVIDRVKQVIGKALEGGVLRKEDEYKYEKILPTIGNPAPVVKAKLEGLEKAIRQRRETELNSLEDAGYDVSRYRQRGAPTADKKADPGGIR